MGMNANEVVIVSSAQGPFDPVSAAPGVRMPEGFAGFMTGSPVSFWVEEAGLLLNKALEAEGIPINLPAENLFIKLFPAVTEVSGNYYEAVLRLQFGTVSQARAITAVLNLAGLFSSGASKSVMEAVFLANAPVQNGNSLEIKTGALSEREIQQFIGMFMF